MGTPASCLSGCRLEWYCVLGLQSIGVRVMVIHNLQQQALQGLICTCATGTCKGQSALRLLM